MRQDTKKETSFVLRGIGEREPGRKRGRHREAGDKGGNKLCNIAQYFAIKECKEVGANNTRAGIGIEGYGEWEV